MVTAGSITCNGIARAKKLKRDIRQTQKYPGYGNTLSSYPISSTLYYIYFFVWKYCHNSIEFHVHCALYYTSMTKTKLKQLILVTITNFVIRREVTEMNVSGREADRPNNYSLHPLKRKPTQILMLTQ